MLKKIIREGSGFSIINWDTAKQNKIKSMKAMCSSAYNNRMMGNMMWLTTVAQGSITVIGNNIGREFY